MWGTPIRIRWFFAFRFGAGYRMPVLAPRFHLGACMKSSEGAGPGIRLRGGGVLRLPLPRSGSQAGLALRRMCGRRQLGLRFGSARDLGRRWCTPRDQLASASTISAKGPWRRECFASSTFTRSSRSSTSSSGPLPQRTPTEARRDSITEPQVPNGRGGISYNLAIYRFDVFHHFPALLMATGAAAHYCKLVPWARA